MYVYVYKRGARFTHNLSTGCTCHAKREHRQTFQGLWPESHSRTLVLTVSYVPYSLDSGPAPLQAHHNLMALRARNLLHLPAVTEYESHAFLTTCVPPTLSACPTVCLPHCLPPLLSAALTVCPPPLHAVEKLSRHTRPLPPPHACRRPTACRCVSVCACYTLHPTPHTVHRTPYALRPTPCNQHPMPVSLACAPHRIARTCTAVSQPHRLYEPHGAEFRRSSEPRHSTQSARPAG